MKTSPRLFAVLLALSVLPLAQVLYPGCATLGGGATEKVRVKSKPSGAQVFLNGHAIGQTPVTLRFSRWGQHRLRLEMAGFEPYDLPLKRGGNWNSMPDYLLIAPIVVDAMTGAIFQHYVPKADDDRLLKNFDWKKEDDAEHADLYVAVGLHPLGPARKIGQMVPRKK